MEKRLDQQNKKLEYAPVTNYATKVVRRQQGDRKIAIWSAAIDAALAETWDHASSKRNHEDVREDAASPKLYQAWGNFLFLNVKDVSFTNLRIMRSPAYAFLAGNGEDLLFRDITVEECFSDGVHILGPAKNIVVKDIAGVTGDDFVALLSYRGETSEGPIDHVWIKGLRMEGGHRGMRLLASNGIQGDNPLTNVAIQDVTGTRDLKMSVYASLQLLEPLRAVNAAADAGFMDWIFLENIDFLDSYALHGYNKWNGCIQVHTNIGHLYLKNIRGGRPNITVGPVAVAKHADAAPGYTLEFPHPDIDCQVEEMVLEGFPEADRDSIVELVRGKQGVGKVKNLIFK